MTRLSKIPAKIAFSFCTLFSLYFPAAFSQQVDTAWVRRYNGPGNGDDKAVAIAVDSSGNVYVTGSSFESTTGYDYCTIKYLPNGDTGWVRRYDGPANKDDFVSALVLDRSGNVYVTGRSNGDFATIKYDSAGNELWVQLGIANIIRLAGLGAYALGLDGSCNVYVTGSIWDGETGEYMFTVKYDSLGNLLWEINSFEGKRAVAIAVDTSGNAYITGYGLGPNLADYITVKYYPNGDTAWSRRYNGPANGNDYANDIALGQSGNVYVTGSSSGDYATIKYDSIGNRIWVRRLHNLFTVPDDGAFALAVDSKENVYVTGMQASDEIVPYWATLKYDSAGNQIWWEGFGGGTIGLAIAVGADENAFVAGRGYAVARYSATGNQLWVKSYDGVGQANALTLDTRGNVYVTGFSAGNGTGNDYATIKYFPLPQLKGDLNLDGALSTADVVLMLNCAFLGEAPPAAPSACDLNCDGKLSGADVVILLRMVFSSALAPC